MHTAMSENTHFHRFSLHKNRDDLGTASLNGPSRPTSEMVQSNLRFTSPAGIWDIFTGPGNQV